MVKVIITIERDYIYDLEEFKQNPKEYVESDLFAFLDDESTKVVDVKLKE